MTRNNPHIGSSFESWLDEEGIREEVTAAAIKAVAAHHLANRADETCGSAAKLNSPRHQASQRPGRAQRTAPTI